MMDALENLINKVQAPSSLSALEGVFVELGKLLGYSSCTIIAVDDTGDSPVIQQKVGVHSELMEDWLDNNLFSLTQLSRMKSSPVVLREIEPNQAPNAFLLPLGANTLQKTLLLVEFEPNITEEIMEKVSWFWMILGHYALKTFERCNEASAVPFTKREVECIRWVSKGKTSWEVSKILGVSERTVNFHIQNCMKKTNSVNRQQVISKCLLGGII